MSDVLSRLKGIGAIKPELVSESNFFKPKEAVQTAIPIVNVAYSGAFDGGVVPGLHTIAGPSKHFKSNLGLVGVKAYMKKFPDAICLFYDCEFGITMEYLQALGIDISRVAHLPFMNIEELKFDIMQKLDALKRGDKVIIFIDSIGNAASKKEVEDALDGNSATDMTRAKSLKSLFRMVTPHLTNKEIPCTVINHTYDTQEMYSKKVVSGGTGVMYSSNSVWIIGREQEKDGKEVVGYSFTINIEKSRFVREKSKFKFTVKFDGGINKWSGLLDLAVDLGFVKKGKIGNSNGFSRVDTETGEVEEAKFKEDETNTKDFWLPLLMNADFRDKVRNEFQLAVGSLLDEEDED